MKTLTYYLPLEGSKTTAVFLIYNNSKKSAIARGVAFCSSKDQFNKKRGRAIAKGRAAKAYAKDSTCPNNKIKRSTVPSMGFTNKCEFKPFLTEFEKSLIAKIDR